MFTVVVPQFLYEHADRLLELCRLGNRGDGSDGTKEQQKTGIIGQNVALLALGQPLMQPTNEHDGGTDIEVFGKRIDVKTMGRSVDVMPHHVNNLVATQIQLNADAYLFMSLNKTTSSLTVCGWLPKSLFRIRSRAFKKGDNRVRDDGSSFCLKSDMHEVSNKDICSMAQNWPELWMEIDRWSQAHRILSKELT